MSNSPSRLEHDLARVPLGAELQLACDDRIQRISARDHGADLASFDIADEVAEHDRLEHRAAIQPEILEVELAQVEIDDRTGYRAGHGIASPPPQDLQKLTKLAAADDVDPHVDTLLSEALNEVGGAGDDT